MKPFDQITMLRKSGRLDEAYEAATAWRKKRSKDPWRQLALFWVLPDLCKRAITHRQYTGTYLIRPLLYHLFGYRLSPWLISVLSNKILEYFKLFLMYSMFFCMVMFVSITKVFSIFLKVPRFVL